ncbi:MAG: hypothetical protein RMK20_03550, partial [Verrucomicrobiales bacterium]|nr:hypothetical protein [Verrucomicrobiales bacterium]
TGSPAASKSPAVPGAASDTGDLAGFWAFVLDAVGRVSPFTRAYLVELRPVSFANNTLVIGYGPDFADRLGLVDNARTRELLQAALTEAGYRDVQIKFVKVQSAPAPASQPTSTAPATATTPASAPSPSPPVTAPASPRTVPSSPARQPAASPAVLSVEDFKNDPLIRRALEIFRGQIVSVRASGA